MHARNPSLTVLYDADCAFCTWTARSLRRLDRRQALRLVPLQTAALPDQPSRDRLIDSVHAVDGAGRWWAGGDAWLEISRRVPALRIVALLGRLPGGRLLVDVGYRLLAAHRDLLARLIDLAQCVVRR